MTPETIIVGGGLAGLTSAIHLAKSGVQVLLIEKNQYPFHKVCGEYVSNEVLPYLRSLEVDPLVLSPSRINTLHLSSLTGKNVSLSLKMGGFGISRFCFDNLMYYQAKNAGAIIETDTKVYNIKFHSSSGMFVVNTDKGIFHSQLVIGAHGKRSNIDKTVKRSFLDQHSPYMAVKYHVRAPFDENIVGLHSFSKGYCGISKIEDDKVNVCYLSYRGNIKETGSIEALEEKFLFQNPYLKKFFSSVTEIVTEPEIINEINFDVKEPVFNHMLLAGDSAGMIAPISGNGMANAIRSGKFAAEAALSFIRKEKTRQQMEEDYSRLWHKNFRYRIKTGRFIQKLFSQEKTADLFITLGKIKPISRWIMRQLHGDEF
jgi:menaquinone-9 beta-reductase